MQKSKIYLKSKHRLGRSPRVKIEDEKLKMRMWRNKPIYRRSKNTTVLLYNKRQRLSQSRWKRG